MTQKSFADSSADLLALRLKACQPFIFVRYGDGALECILGKPGGTCDGELYTKPLAEDLKRCWNLLFTRPEQVVIGHWLSASFDERSFGNRYEGIYESLIRENTKDSFPMFLHFEALLLMRDSHSLVEFYRTVRNDKRRKLLMGPEAWAKGAEALNADFYGIPVVADLHTRKEEIKEELCRRDFEVLLYGAGMAGNIPVIDYWNDHPEKTYVNLGSALDPLYRGRSRKQQLDYANACVFMGKVCE
jgi:hypothetical protein